MSSSKKEFDKTNEGVAGSPTKRKKISDIGVIQGRQSSKIYVTAVLGDIELWYVEKEPGVDGFVYDIKVEIESKGDSWAKSKGFRCVAVRRISLENNEKWINPVESKNNKAESPGSKEKYGRCMLVRLVEESTKQSRKIFGLEFEKVRK